MKQPWIQNIKSDVIWILSPPYLVLFVIFIFQNQIEMLQKDLSIYIWLLIIVFIDVAHVYATLFKTYFIKKEVQNRKLLYYGLPIFSFILALILYQMGSITFWSVLALVAVFHFIRQQYGFMRLYARLEPNTISKKIDEIAIYAATIFPMLYWFSTPRKFNWFIENEFLWIQGKLTDYLSLFQVFYLVILIVWVVKTFYNWLKNQDLNWPKNILIIGTYLSWYFGIVYFDNDLIFTTLNVVSHGIPYMALVYFREITQKTQEELRWLFIFKTSIGGLFFVGLLFFIAFSEEFLWEILVWKEYFSISGLDVSTYLLMLIIPLLTTPQLTHYLLDGFIWKTKKKD